MCEYCDHRRAEITAIVDGVLHLVMCPAITGAHEEWKEGWEWGFNNDAGSINHRYWPKEKSQTWYLGARRGANEIDDLVQAAADDQLNLRTHQREY